MQIQSHESALYVLPIHFDVPTHTLPLFTFVETAQATERIVEALTREINANIRLQVLVLPPDDGSFLTRLGIWVLGGWGLLWTFTESDIGQALIKGLTLHEPAYWSEMIGTAIRARLTESGVSKAEAEASIDQAVCAAIVGEMTKGFLQREVSNLTAAGLDYPRYIRAYEARTRFYETCESTHNLRAIGFEEHRDFPIKREDFHRLKAAPPPPDDEDSWSWGITTFKVTSPNWDRDDKQRQWKGKDPEGRDRYFRIEDPEFWYQINTGRLSPHIVDVMRAQWAYIGTEDHPRNCRILRVLDFNGVRLSEPLGELEVETLLGPCQPRVSQQDDLFD